MSSSRRFGMNLVVALALVLLGALGRVALADFPNIETVMVASFIAAVFLGPGLAMAVCVSSMIISDLLMGNAIFAGERMNQIIMFTYSGFAIVSLISMFGKWKARAALSKITAKSVFASAGIGMGLALAYDVWTNLGWWYLMYPHTMANLAAVFAAGVPFMIYHALSGAVTFALIGLPAVSLLNSREAQSTPAAQTRISAVARGAPAIAMASLLIVLSFSGCVADEGALSSDDATEASMIIYGDGWTIECMNVSIENDTVYSFLCRCASEGGFALNATYSDAYDSIYVEEINGTKNGQDGKYWMYYINGELVWEAADKQAVSGGDLVEWKFEAF